jgi:hypothetical protein
MPEMYRGPEAALQPADYAIPRIEIDHALLLADGDAAWADVPVLTWGPAPYETRFRAAWSGAGIVVRFDADDEGPWATREQRDDRLWEEEVVEIFVDPTCTGRDYLELEISPANVVCDLHIASLEPHRDVRLDWDFPTLESRVHRTVDGRRWTAAAWLPLADFATASPAVARCVPPRAGDVWHFNVFRIKRPHGPAEPERDAIYAAWSVPDGTTFHTPSAFRPLRFVER